MTAPTMERVSARSLISAEFFTRLSARVQSTNNLTPEMAARVTDQALAYLATCAQKPAGAPSLNMSRAVDAGWHAFLEYSAQYDQFFASYGWPKVHHNPCDGWGGATYPPASEVLPFTVAAIEEAGYAVDPELWTAHTDCGDTCGDDGGGGNPLPTCEHSV
ncbi:hypothetical protein ACX6XY_03580 [Streptomyces sp. O3]